MGSLSRMAKKCQACPNRDNCDHKRMEACAYIDEPKVTVSNTISNGINTSAGISNVENIGIGDISKEIEKSLRKKLSMKCGW